MCADTPVCPLGRALGLGLHRQVLTSKGQSLLCSQAAQACVRIAHILVIVPKICTRPQLTSTSATSVLHHHPFWWLLISNCHCCLTAPSSPSSLTQLLWLVIVFQVQARVGRAAARGGSCTGEQGSAPSQHTGQYGPFRVGRCAAQHTAQHGPFGVGRCAGVPACGNAPEQPGQLTSLLSTSKAGCRS